MHKILFIVAALNHFVLASVCFVLATLTTTDGCVKAIMFQHRKGWTECFRRNSDLVTVCCFIWLYLFSVFFFLSHTKPRHPCTRLWCLFAILWADNIHSNNINPSVLLFHVQCAAHTYTHPMMINAFVASTSFSFARFLIFWANISPLTWMA